MAEKVGAVAIKQSFKRKTRLKFWTTIRAPQNLKHHKTRLKSAFLDHNLSGNCGAALTTFVPARLKQKQD